jgi:hypothetical protein
MIRRPQLSLERNCSEREGDCLLKRHFPSVHAASIIAESHWVHAVVI